MIKKRKSRNQESKNQKTKTIIQDVKESKQAMSLQSSGFSLVKYDTPILVSKTFGKTGAGGGGSSAAASAKTSASSL